MRNEERISYNTKQVSAARTYVESGTYICEILLPQNNRTNKKKTLFFFKKMASFFKNLLIFLLPSEICHIP